MVIPRDSGESLKFDEIGYWSEIKLDIIKAYAREYSKILSNQPGFHHVYIDAFAGAGKHISKTTKSFIPGSPLNALNVEPPFPEYYFIDIKRSRVRALSEIAEQKPNVHVYEGDCNEILLQEIFPKVRFEDFRRGLCLLDPYGLDLDWRVIEAAGRKREKGSIEIFLNFPLMDMNRNVFWRNPERVSGRNLERMNRFWGDESWREIVYDTTGNLFGFPEKQSNFVIAHAFQKRLRDVAGFKYVPEPLPLRNTKGAIVYYLFFASPKPVAARIVSYIFDKYRGRGAQHGQQINH